jgi:hypothetical protein
VLLWRDIPQAGKEVDHSTEIESPPCRGNCFAVLGPEEGGRTGGAFPTTGKGCSALANVLEGPSSSPACPSTAQGPSCATACCFCVVMGFCVHPRKIRSACRLFAKLSHRLCLVKTTQFVVSVLVQIRSRQAVCVIQRWVCLHRHYCLPFFLPSSCALSVIGGADKKVASTPCSCFAEASGLPS